MFYKNKIICKKTNAINVRFRTNRNFTFEFDLFQTTEMEFYIHKMEQSVFD